MKQLPLLAGIGLALAGCTTTGWSEAPLDDGRYASPAPVGWWGRDAASVDLFYAPLAGHGTWGLHPRYGRVFLPGVGPGWQPYAQGYWRQDPRYGRTWVSAEPWGWATYHYGRWGRDSRLGWFWVPDTRFGPGWVDWRAGNGWASWSPLPPWGWSSWGYGWGNDWWVHAPAGWVYRPGLHDHVRRGRHDYDRGRYEYGRDRHPRDTRSETPRPPRVPVAVDPGAVDPGAQPAVPPPAWVGGERRPADGRYSRGERQPPRDGWVGGTAPGLERQPRGVHPRSAPPAVERTAAAPAPRAEPARSAPAPRAEPSRAAPRAEPPPRETVREAPRGRDVPARVADD